MNMREAFEAWYAENAFDYAKTTIGSRDCGLQWTAFHAGAAFAARECAGIANSADKSTHPAVIADDILIAFPEAWK